MAIQTQARKETNKKITFWIFFIPLLISTLALAFDVQPVKGGGIIYIRPDGSIDPPTAPIKRDGYIYYFMADINASIIIERDNIVLDGRCYTLYGPGQEDDFIGVIVHERVNVTIRAMKIRAFKIGISLWESNYINIIDNNVIENACGIFIQDSSDNIIASNNVTANTWDGIVLSSSSNNYVHGNTLTDNWSGVWLEYSSGNEIRCNTFINNGLFVYHSYQNVVVDNLVNGKPLVYLEGVFNYVVDKAGQVVLINCDNVSVMGLDLSKATVGVQLWNTTNTMIIENTIEDGWIGVWLRYSNNNHIAANNIRANAWDGLVIWNSSNNYVAGNSITANAWSGIWLGYSNKSDVVSNDIIANGEDGIILFNSYDNTITSNNVTTNALNGIWLISSGNNAISGNIMARNRYGIYLEDASLNKIYHNNFIDNVHQASVTPESLNIWDDGYPSGGNFWSDYVGVDEKSGPKQNLPGSDGIGDTPYIIDAYNRDHYPLMNPVWDVAVIDIKLEKTVVGRGYSTKISVTVMNQGRYTETFNLSIYANTTAITTQSLTLDSWSSTTIIFAWNTSGFAKGKYTISAYATPVPREIDITDNTFIDGIVTVTIPGDVDGDFDVDIYDVVRICYAYAAKTCEPRYHENPNCDINCDSKIDIYDVVIACANYGKKCHKT